MTAVLATVEPVAMLRHELAVQGLLLPWAEYRTAYAKVEEAGEEALATYALPFAAEDWVRANEALPRAYSHNDLVRILGFGVVLTRFLASYMGDRMLPDARRPIAPLGALANIIVTLYDHFMEQRAGEELLPVPVLTALAQGRTTRVAEPGGSPQKRILQQLVAQYFELLRSASQPEDSGLLRFLSKAIFRMYEAEQGTLRAPMACAPHVLRRKSALPFVVMGAPIWLGATIPHNLFWRHVAWMYRFGRFVAWLDDFTDYSLDRAVGHSNRLAWYSAPEWAPLAKHVAMDGKHVLQQWRVHASDSGDRLGADAMLVLATSWIGT